MFKSPSLSDCWSASTPVILMLSNKPRDAQQVCRPIVLSRQFSYVCHVCVSWKMMAQCTFNQHLPLWNKPTGQSESLLWEANLAWGRKSSQLHAEDRMSFLIMEMDREKISNFYGQRNDVCDCESVHHAISASLLTRRTPCRDVKWNKICNCRVFFGVIYSLLCVFICSCCKNINMIHLKHKTLQLNIFI